MFKRSYGYASVLFVALVFAILPLHAQLAEGPWPMFHHDPQRTGQGECAGSDKPILSWSYQVGGWIWGSPCIAADGSIYVGDWQDSHLYAFTPSGALNWSYRAGAAIIASPAVNENGRICMASWDGKVYFLKPSGAPSIIISTGDMINSSPLVTPDGCFYVGSDSNHLWAFQSNGSFKWQFIAPTGNLYSSPAMGQNGLIYVGSEDNRLYAVRSDGYLVWTYLAGDKVDAGPSIDADGRIYCGARNNVVYCLAPSGALMWTYRMGNPMYTTAAVSSSGEICMGGTYDNTLYAFTSGGDLIWSYRTADNIFSSAAIGADGQVYFGSYDYRLYSLTPSGALSWSYSTGSRVRSSPSIGVDGRLCVGSDDNRLYVFEPPPTPTPNYVELDVTNGTDFSSGEKINLQWEAFEDSYGFRNVPCAVYLAAALDPPSEDTTLTVKQIVSSKALFIFDSKMRPVKYNPQSLQATFNGVKFPLRGTVSSGSLSFTAPKGAPGRWVFAAAFIKKGDGFPSQPPVEVSNGFDLN